ncbi:uncharacterized protein METZ01_LOCUS489485 [marine metagenome]|uniref:TRL-like protein family n=1 Tax=marine metagenome TaxID=408172 RepID=A0A383CWU4_9ZZZZ|tara:strand:- start:108 stop:383 length:276 start_codon:yes stop_codon:yes gene_type:complete
MKLSKKAIILILSLLIVACSTTVPVSATGSVASSKIGTAKQTTLLSIIKLGDEPTIENAAKNGNITNVNTVHYKTTIIPFGISVECIVRGN